MNKQAHNYIFEYHDAITSGRIRAGKWIKAIYKILVEGIKNGEWVFDQKKANKAIKFIENYLSSPQRRGRRRYLGNDRRKQSGGLYNFFRERQRNRCGRRDHSPSYGRRRNPSYVRRGNDRERSSRIVTTKP